MADEAEEDILFDEEEIRDTNTHYSDIGDCRGFKSKTVLIYNDLDQTVTLQMQGSRDRDFNRPINISSSFTVPANSTSYQTCTDYFPFGRITAKCDTAPTTGSLTVVVVKDVV